MFIFLCRLIVLFTLNRLFICLDNIVFVFPHVCPNIYYFDWAWILSILFHISNLMVSTKAFCSRKLLSSLSKGHKKKTENSILAWTVCNYWIIFWVVNRERKKKCCLWAMSIHSTKDLWEFRVVLLSVWFSLCLRCESQEMELYCQTRRIKTCSNKQEAFFNRQKESISLKTSVVHLVTDLES